MPEIKFSEKEIETYFCGIVSYQFECRVIGSQIKLKCGILDVLMRGRESGYYFVVELKKDKLKDSDLAQVLAYVTELRCKHPSRTFIPVLLGSGIEATYLEYCLDAFCPYTEPTTASCIIYGWSLEDGVSLSWHNISQKDNEDYRVELTETSSMNSYFRKLPVDANG